MTDAGDRPAAPTDRLAAGGWERTETTTETLFRLPTIRVSGETHLYEDVNLRGQIREATAGDLDMPWRFFFATRLVFRPPLAPGIGPATLLPTVTTEARRSFADDLADRGFRDIDRGRTQRTRTRSGERLRLTKYTARYPVRYGDGYDIDIEGWVGVWVENSTFHLAGGAYPTRGFRDLLAAVGAGTDTDPATYRNECLDLVRGAD